MSAIDLTEAIDAAARARWERTPMATRLGLAWDDVSDRLAERVRADVAADDIAAAAPFIARQVADSIAAEIEAMTPREPSTSGWLVLRTDAASIAREWSPA